MERAGVVLNPTSKLNEVALRGCNGNEWSEKSSHLKLQGRSRLRRVSALKHPSSADAKKWRGVIKIPRRDRRKISAHHKTRIFVPIHVYRADRARVEKKRN